MKVVGLEDESSLQSHKLTSNFNGFLSNCIVVYNYDLVTVYILNYLWNCQLLIYFSI